jgi:hypothetical protein
MPKRSSLEADLTALTQEFVARIVETIRNASFADVAALGKPQPELRIERPKKPAPPLTTSEKRRPRQTADKRAELSDRVLRALTDAGAPMGVRALSSTLNVAPDLLAVPLKELRSEGRITKHGDKRNTTYSAA